MLDAIPLRFVKNNITGSRFAFNNNGNSFYYLNATIYADFKLSYESLAQYTTKVLDLASLLEGAGLTVKLVEIKNGNVKVW